MFNENQLQVLESLAQKWKIWEETRVSLFTHEDKLKLDKLHVAMGLGPIKISCNACFMDDIGAVMKAYEKQKQSGECNPQGEATGDAIKEKK